MDSTDLSVLRHFRDGPALARDLLDAIPRTTAYRRMAALADAGLLEKDGPRYALTPAGEARLDQEQPGAPGNALEEAERHLPHLGLMPHPLFRAVLFLIACAISARSHRLLDQHHAGFVLFGPRLTWKTWLGRVACYLAGEDPNRNVIYAPSETGRSIHARRNAAGETVSARAAFQSRIAVLDEFGRAAPPVRRLAQIHLFGQLQYPYENELLDAPAVPVLALNPIEGKSTLEGKLGLDEAMLRRVVPVSVDGAAIPAHLLTEGDVVLEQIAALGPATFVEPKSGWIPRDEVRTALQATLDTPERLAGIDIVMVAQLAAGATAWLSEEQAIDATLTAYLTVVTPLGWTQPDWPLRLRDALTPSDPRVTSNQEPSPAPVPVTQASGAYDYRARVALLLGTCNELEINPEDAKERLQLVGALHAQGLTAHEVKALSEALQDERLAPVDLLRDYVNDRRAERSLESDLKRLKTRRSDLEAALDNTQTRLEQAHAQLREVEIPPQSLHSLQNFSSQVQALGLDLQTLGPLVQITRDVACLTGSSADRSAGLASDLLAAIQQEVSEADSTVTPQQVLLQLASLGRSSLAPSREAARLTGTVEGLRKRSGDLERRRDDASNAVARSERRLKACHQALAQEEERLHNARRATAFAHQQLAQGREALNAQENAHAFVADVTAFLTSELQPCDAVWAWLDQLRFGAQAGRLTRSQAHSLIKRIQTRLREQLSPPPEGNSSSPT
jgi:hypothetical protein